MERNGNLDTIIKKLKGLFSIRIGDSRYASAGSFGNMKLQEYIEQLFVHRNRLALKKSLNRLELDLLFFFVPIKTIGPSICCYRCLSSFVARQGNHRRKQGHTA